jgi:hypothetical protein
MKIHEENGGLKAVTEELTRLLADEILPGGTMAGAEE